MAHVKFARGLPQAGTRAAAAGSALRPLGEILVERGLLSRAELDDVLREQRTTRRRLGAMLVLRGTLSQPELTDALRVQLDALGPPPGFQRDGVLQIIARALRPRPATHLPELTHDLDRLARSVAGRRTRVRDAHPEADARLAAELADLRAELNHVHRLVVTQGAEIAGLRGRAPEVTEAAETVADEPPSATAAELDDRAAHLVFKPAAAGGYELLEREGSLPVEGEALEIDRRRFIAMKVGSSPLPVDRRACAYLHPE